jgi:hypothetical protein
MRTREYIIMFGILLIICAIMIWALIQYVNSPDFLEMLYYVQAYV